MPLYLLAIILLIGLLLYSIASYRRDFGDKYSDFSGPDNSSAKAGSSSAEDPEKCDKGDRADKSEKTDKKRKGVFSRDRVQDLEDRLKNAANAKIRETIDRKFGEYPDAYEANYEIIDDDDDSSK